MGFNRWFFIIIFVLVNDDNKSYGIRVSMNNDENDTDQIKTKTKNDKPDIEVEVAERWVWHDRFTMLVEWIICRECKDERDIIPVAGNCNAYRKWTPRHCCDHCEQYYSPLNKTEDKFPDACRICDCDKDRDFVMHFCVIHSKQYTQKNCRKAKFWRQLFRREKRERLVWQQRVGLVLDYVLCKTCIKNKNDAWNGGDYAKAHSWTPRDCDSCSYFEFYLRLNSIRFVSHNS